MKQLIARTLTSLLLAVGFLAGTANGEATSWVVKVNIPFEFNVGNKTFPAGSYSLVQPLQHFLVLRDSRGQTVASVFTQGIESNAPMAAAKLRFDSVAGQHTLTEVWQQQESTASDCIRQSTAQMSRSGRRLKPAKLRKEANRKLTFGGGGSHEHCDHHHHSGAAGEWTCGGGDSLGTSRAESSSPPGAEIMKRIGTVKQTLIGLAMVFGEEAFTPNVLGLWDDQATKTTWFHASLSSHSDGDCHALRSATGYAGAATKIPGTGRAA